MILNLGTFCNTKHNVPFTLNLRLKIMIVESLHCQNFGQKIVQLIVQRWYNSQLQHLLGNYSPTVVGQCHCLLIEQTTYTQVGNLLLPNLWFVQYVQGLVIISLPKNTWVVTVTQTLYNHVSSYIGQPFRITAQQLEYDYAIDGQPCIMIMTTCW